jgi:hypothetical protein
MASLHSTVAEIIGRWTFRDGGGGSGGGDRARTIEIAGGGNGSVAFP